MLRSSDAILSEGRHLDELFDQMLRQRCGGIDSESNDEAPEFFVDNEDAGPDELDEHRSTHILPEGDISFRPNWKGTIYYTVLTQRAF